MAESESFGAWLARMARMRGVRAGGTPVPASGVTKSPLGKGTEKGNGPFGTPVERANVIKRPVRLPNFPVLSRPNPISKDTDPKSVFPRL